MSSKGQKNELIRELRELGRLLDPRAGPTSSEEPGPEPDDTPTETIVETQETLVDPTGDTTSPETVDMFSTEPETEESDVTHSKQAAEPDSGHGNTIADTDSFRDAPTQEHPSPLPTEKPTASAGLDNTDLSREAIVELSRELVETVEKTISRRSGEPLDESLRDKLLYDVSRQLTEWLVND